MKEVAGRKEELHLGEKRIRSFKEVDFSGLFMPMIAIYKSPDDYKEKCVARIFDLDKPTDTVMVADTVEEIVKDIRRNTSLVFAPAAVGDVRSLVGVYM